MDDDTTDAAWAEQELQERDSRRLLARVDKSGDCWIWMGSRHRQGYGRLGFRGNRSTFAHRASYELHVGPIPPGMVVMHVCDNPPCVNPAHLRVGTQRDNNLDMLAKGRGNRASGIRHTKAKLTEEQAKRAKYGDEPLQGLSEEFGVTYQTLHYIRTGKTWKQI